MLPRGMRFAPSPRLHAFVFSLAAALCAPCAGHNAKVEPIAGLSAHPEARGADDVRPISSAGELVEARARAGARYGVANLASRQELCVSVRHGRTDRQHIVGIPYLP